MVTDRLLESAIEQFATRGFEGASTRDIARASGTAMSSITYHFGGKEGLYLAAADYIARCIQERHGPMLAALRADPPDTADAARDALLVLIDRLAQMMLAPKSVHWAQFIGREQQSPTAAFDRLYEGVMGEMVDALRTLAGRVRPDLDARVVTATVILMFGQVLVLRVGRATICRALTVDVLGDAEESLLRDRLRANILLILSGPSS